MDLAAMTGVAPHVPLGVALAAKAAIVEDADVIPVARCSADHKAEARWPQSVQTTSPRNQEKESFA